MPTGHHLPPLSLMLVLGILLPVFSQAQGGEPVVPDDYVTPDNVRGLVPTASYDGGHERVNLYNGSLQLQIPLFSLPGRNGHSVDLSARYTGGKPYVRRRELRFSDASGIELCTRPPVPGPEEPGQGIAGPWDLEVRLAPELRYLPGRTTNVEPIKRRHRYLLTELDGTSIEFFETSALPEYPEHLWLAKERFRTGGSTHLSLVEHSTGDNPDVTVLYPDGSRVFFENVGLHQYVPVSFTDSNGNRIDYLQAVDVPLSAEDLEYIADVEAEGYFVTVTGVRDTLGRLVKKFVRSGQGMICPDGRFRCDLGGLSGVPVETIVKVRNSQGDWLSYTVTHEGLDDGDDRSTSRLHLPSGLAYIFEWRESDPFTICESTAVPGVGVDIRPVQVSYPNGGYTRYEWAGGSRVVAKHRCPRADAVSACEEETTTYERTVPGVTGVPRDVTVVHPDETLEIYSFNAGALETQVQTIASSGELLRTVSTVWSAAGESNVGGAPSKGWWNPVRTERREVLHRSGEVRKTEWLYDAAGYTVPGQAVRDTTGNVTVQRDFDWGVGAPGVLLRTVEMRYVTQQAPGDSQYGIQSDTHILGLPLWTETRDGSGAVAARADFEYDVYGAGEPQARLNPTQYAAPVTRRGNLTRIRQARLRSWTSGTAVTVDGGSEATTTKYDVLGNVIEVVSPEGSRVTHDFSDRWSDSSCSPVTQSTFAQPTATTRWLSSSVGHTVERSYLSCGSLLGRVRDVNGHETSFSYNFLNRVAAATSPDGGREDWYYSDIDAGVLHRGESVFENPNPLPIRTAHFRKIDEAQDSESLAVLDGLGRLVLGGQRNGDLFDWTATEYDVMGREVRVSRPITAAKQVGDQPVSSIFDATWTTTTYDALSRPLTVTRPDGAITRRDYFGARTETTDPAGNHKLTTTDGLGRVVEVVEGESSGIRLRAPSGSADLRTSVSCPSTTVAGGEILIDVTVYNAGPDDSSPFTILVNLPAGIIYSGGSGEGVTKCTNDGEQLTCSHGSVAVAQTATLSVTATVNATAGDLVTYATVESTTDPSHADNSASAVTSVVEPKASLSATMSAPSSASLESDFTYSISVTNSGPDTAVGVLLIDELPAGVRFLGSSGSGWSCGVNGQHVLCERASLGFGTSTVGLTVRAEASGTWFNAATVGSSTTDPSPGDNVSNSVGTVVTADADLEIAQTASAAEVIGRRSLVYELSVTNHGPAPASGVQVVDTLPDEVTFISAAGDGWSCSHSGGVVTCDASGQLPVGLAPPISLEVETPFTPSWLTNAASVAASNPDPESANNQADQLVEVYVLVPIKSGKSTLLVPVRPGPAPQP